MKPRIFLDTNVVLDLLGERVPFYKPAAQIASLADNGSIELFSSALSYATVNYILSKSEGAEIAKEKLIKFQIISKISSLDESVIEKGLNSKFSDFEDSLQYFSALKSNCNIIITRNGKDFKRSQIPIMTPNEYLRSLEEH
jgi:predicted nucleic acid-binding protein